MTKRYYYYYCWTIDAHFRENEEDNGLRHTTIVTGCPQKNFCTAYWVAGLRFGNFHQKKRWKNLLKLLVLAEKKLVENNLNICPQNTPATPQSRQAMYKMLHVMINGVPIPVLIESVELPLPVHIVIHSDRIAGLTEQGWIQEYKNINDCHNAELFFVPVADLA